MRAPATDTAVLIPVKDLGQAKTRLATLLDAEERRALAGILLTGVLEAVSALEGVARRAVVSNHPPALELARDFGLEVLEEGQQTSESASVDAASAALEAEGIGAVLRVPLDLPLIDAGELERVVARGRALAAEGGGSGGVLVPSRDGTGTNAVYRAPPTLFPSRFGPGSLALHEGHLRELGVPYAVLPLTSLALDLDDPLDVAELLHRRTDCPAARYLESLDADRRLAELAAREA